MAGSTTALDLTQVLYNDSSVLSLALALITLSPVLLMPAYAALAVQTRELVIINMWAGQFLCEGFNWILKRAIRQDRPSDSLSSYGFPSSHSQYMGYFSSFLVCHLYFRHRFPTTGYPLLDRAFRVALYFVITGWAAAVAYSRFHLIYHTLHQILWGLGIGIAFGALYYVTTELEPQLRPNGRLGRSRSLLLNNPISVWLRIRDGWLVWPDGGHEEEWKRWRADLNRQRPAETRRSR